VVEAEARALDGFAWLAQLALFLTLGLLAAPSHIAAIAAPALAVALTLTLVARPIATFITLAPFRFRLHERIFAAWAGLRGATPIFLGLAPAALGAPNANLYFSMAFVAVGVSLVAQGWTTPLAARLLGVAGEETEARPLRIGALRGVAVGGAIAAAVAASIAVARIATPAPGITVTPATVAELEGAVGRPGGAIVTSLPADWTDVEDPERRRRLFAATLRPIVQAENARLRAERAEVEAFLVAEERGLALSLGAQARRDVLARAYGLRYEDLDALLARVATRANSLFGRRPSDDGEQGRDSFDDLAESVEEYADTLNAHPAFAAFRDARAAARADGREPTAAELAPFIAPFAADGAAFAASVEEMLQSLPPPGAAS
jgi:cell volume regulation protein A